MEYNKEDFGKSGIYCIRNIQNKKLYVGKAKCIYSRIKQHVTLLNTKNKDENRHLIHAWHKYGREYFEYEVLEYLEFNETLLKERELYWILSKNTLDRNIGYNLRLDSSTGLITSQETRDRLSKASTGRKVKESTRSLLRDRWKDENRLSKMKIALSKSRSRNSGRAVVKLRLLCTRSALGMPKGSRKFVENPQIQAIPGQITRIGPALWGVRALGRKRLTVK